MISTNIFGFSSPKFTKIKELFRKNFESGWEREGAALAIYHRGKLVVDLQGGYADASSLRQWTADTRTVVFSATKAVGALCIAMLVDRGLMNYADLVSKHWPEFSQNGKENIRVDWIMNHRAGLAFFDEKITREDAINPEKIARIIEKQKPNWTPGTHSGYHAITFGWLVDQLIRRVDLKQRGIAQFFREEISIPFKIDFHIGLPPQEEYTVSRIASPPYNYVLREFLYDPRIIIVPMILHIRLPGSMAKKVKKKSPDWLRLDKNAITFNDPEVHRIEQVAALGITKARDLGKIFALLLEGKLVSKNILDLFRKPQIYRGRDRVIMVPMAKGHGFFYERHPYKQNSWLVGHPGFGGSTVMMDMENEVVISYVTNGLKTGMGELTRTYRLLRNALFDCLEDTHPSE